MGFGNLGVPQAVKQAKELTAGKSQSGETGEVSNVNNTNTNSTTITREKPRSGDILIIELKIVLTT